MGIMSQLDGMQLEEKHGSRFKFRMHMAQSMSDMPLEALYQYNSLPADKQDAYLKEVVQINRGK